MFGSAALVQRCTLHKRRNVADYLSERERGSGSTARWSGRFTDPDPDKGLRAAAVRIATAWNATNPTAAAIASGKDWRRCSPSAGSGCRGAWRRR